MLTKISPDISDQNGTWNNAVAHSRKNRSLTLTYIGKEKYQ